MGKCITVIAATGQGKTTFVKNMIKGNRCFVFDVNGEYEELCNDTTQPRSKYFGSNKEFMKMASNKHGGTICVFEEATGFLVGAMQKDVREFIIAKRHPVGQGGRNIVFLFHTIGSVPPFIFDMSDYIVLFKTGDDVGTVKKKRLKLLPYFLKLQQAPRHSKVIIKNT